MRGKEDDRGREKESEEEEEREQHKMKCLLECDETLKSIGG